MKPMNVLIGIGLGGAAIGLGVLLYQHARPLGAYSPGKMVAPRQIGATSQGGMTTKLYQSRQMKIEERVALIQQLIYKSVQDPRMRKLALQITQSAPERDGTAEARKIYDAMKSRIRYTGDIAAIKQGKGPAEGIDLYQSAWRTWDIGGGDCDDHSILAATLLTLNGIEAKLRITSPTKGPDWSHIYVVAGLPKTNPSKWVAVDTTLPGSRFGVEAPYARRVDFDA